jgi:hypothetical protein
MTVMTLGRQTPVAVPATEIAWQIWGARIAGDTPLLMRSPTGLRGGTKTSRTKEIPTPEEEAERCLYRDEATGVLVVPADNVRQAMLECGLKQGRTLLRYALAAGLQITIPSFPLTRNGEALTTYDRIDIRRVVVQKNAVLRARPVIEVPWELEVRYLFDRAILSPDAIASALQVAGQAVGILDYRPKHGGPYGRFHVVEAWVEE